jgi:hypothetical protein
MSGHKEAQNAQIYLPPGALMKINGGTHKHGW